MSLMVKLGVTSKTLILELIVTPLQGQGITSISEKTYNGTYIGMFKFPFEPI